MSSFPSSNLDKDPTTAPPTPRGGLIVMILFALVWSGFTFAADWFIFHSAILQVIAESYPTTKGRVTFSGLAEHRSSKGRTSFTPDVRFSYEVAARSFSGDRYRYGQFGTNRRMRP